MKVYYKVCLFSILYLVSLSVFSQREVIVEPTRLGILNDVISGDTLENGDRVDPNTVYILRRNGVYKTPTSIFNGGFKLTIRAEDGPGAMPIIQPTPLDGGDVSRPFNVSDEFELDGIYVTNISDIGTPDTRIIRMNAATTARLKNCWFDGTSQSVIRFDAPGSSVFMENCIISHVGETFDTGNGRIIDVRGTGDIPAADSIVFRNNTVFNISRRIVRHSNDLSTKYLEISNNTFVNSVTQIASIENSLMVKIVDNLFVNPSLAGDNNLFSIDPFTAQNIYIPLGIDPTRRVEVHNNWFYTQPEVLEVWADSVEYGDFFDSDFRFDLVDINGQFFNDTIAAENALLSEPYTFEGPVTFQNAPRPAESIIIGVINDRLFAPSRDDGTAPNWNYATSPFFRIIQGTLTFPWEFPYDFTYDISSAAATSASDGGPVGSMRWTPSVLQDVVVGQEELVANARNSFYPNTYDHFP